MPDFEGIDVLDYVDSDGIGTFNDIDKFKTEALPIILGADFGDTKMFDETTPSLAHLINRFAHSERKIGQKLENVIQKPADDASDEDKAQYRTTLLKALGAKENAEDVEVTMPDLPEGMVKDEAMLKKWIDRWVTMGMPQSMIQDCINHYIADNIISFDDRNNAIAASVTEFKGRHKGSDEIMFVRQAHDALMHFASDDVEAEGQTVKGLKTLIKEAKLYDNPTDYKGWRKHGLDTDQLEIWGNIGARMKSGFAARDEGAGGTKNKEQTMKELGKKMYTHETSQRLHKD